MAAVVKKLTVGHVRYVPISDMSSCNKIRVRVLGGLLDHLVGAQQK